MFQRLTDLRPLRTGDGSYTLFSPTLNERYHSSRGSLNESKHVFIDEGLRSVKADRIDVLEVGLGTGLNALLTWIDADERNVNVRYTALEPFPLDAELIRSVHHPSICDVPELEERFLKMMVAPMGEEQRVSDHFHFTRVDPPVLKFMANEAFDLIYFDAFGPRAQPEMWRLEVMQHLFNTLRPNGRLVTYCAKGVVRRTMEAAGFICERPPGPPGKREMLRAVRPSPR